MADWYVSSAAWTAIPQFAVSGVYSVGNIVRPLTAPVFSAQYAFRCTTAGTASTEPTWGTAWSNNQTVTSGGATFTNVTGQSTYGWSAAAGNLYSISNNGGGGPRPVAGDRVFLSSDHSESSANPQYVITAANAYGCVEVISVNRAGSVPPAAADVLSGAAITFTGSGSFTLDCSCCLFWQGLTFTLGGTASSFSLATNGFKAQYLRNCAMVFTTSSTTATVSTLNACEVTFDNTTVQFNNAGQRFAMASGSAPSDFRWINTPSATLGTVPTTLFLGAGASAPANLVTCRGVDLSAVTTTLYYGNATSNFGKVLLDSCRIASGIVRLGTASYQTSGDEVELVNCYDGTNFISERHTPAGDVTTEFTITLSGGATDNVGTYSHKMVSSTRSDKFVMTLEGFWMDANYATTGSAKTATVEIISSASLNNDEITLVLEYLGTTTSSLASMATSFPNVLTAPSAVTASTATWNSSPATPVKQKLQVTFTPRTVGRVRAQVRLGKASTTVYVDPRVVIT